MWQKKFCIVLIEVDIFNKSVQGNIPKPLRNLYINFDVNTSRHCAEMACAKEDLETLTSLLKISCTIDDIVRTYYYWQITVFAVDNDYQLQLQWQFKPR